MRKVYHQQKQQKYIQLGSNGGLDAREGRRAADGLGEADLGEAAAAAGEAAAAAGGVGGRVTTALMAATAARRRGCGISPNTVESSSCLSSRPLMAARGPARPCSQR